MKIQIRKIRVFVNGSHPDIIDGNKEEIDLADLDKKRQHYKSLYKGRDVRVAFEYMFLEKTEE
jgi:hypothetical protein